MTSRTSWLLRGQPDRPWQVVAVGLLGALVFAGTGALLSRGAGWWPLFGGLIFFALSAMVGLGRLRGRRHGVDRHPGH